MRGTIVPGRNSSGAEAATRCYNAEELLYDFLIIIIRNTSRGLLTVHWPELDCVGADAVILPHASPVLAGDDLEQVVPEDLDGDHPENGEGVAPAGLDGDVVAGAVPVDAVADGEAVVRILLGPVLDLRVRARNEHSWNFQISQSRKRPVLWP